MEQDLEKRLQQLEKHSESRFSELNKRLEDQFRFTRFVVLLCGMTIVGVLVFTVLTTFQSLPAQLIAHYMSNLEPIVYEWVSYEDVMRRNRANRAKEQQNAATKDSLDAASAKKDEPETETK